MLEIRSVLVLSTGHVTETTAVMLNSMSAEEWPITGGHYGPWGWFLYVNVNEQTPADLIPVFEFAVNNGCQHVLLDADAEKIDDLPLYDW